MRKLSSLFVISLCLMLLWMLRPGTMPSVGVPGVVASGGHNAGTLIVDLVDETSLSEIEAFEARYGIDLEYSSAFSRDEALLRAEVPDLAAALAAIAGDPLVEIAEPEVEMMAFGFPNDPLWDKQWNMRMIGAEAGWHVGGGHGVRVAVLDTGVSLVEDLREGRVEAGYSFVRGVKTAADDHGHGTHVAGTIAQATNNELGVAGVAPEVTIVPYKVLAQSGSGAADRIAAAVDHAADSGVDVINLSLGGGHSAVLHKAVNDAAARGVIVVAAAGNTGREGVGCPGHAEDVVGVSAVGPDDKRAFYSTYGQGVEIAAPGGDTRVADGGVLQDTIDGRGGHAYRAFQGTSMATPHVAGAAAVLLGMGLSPQQTLTALYATAHDLGDEGFDEVYGHGRVDLGEAITSVQIGQKGLLFGVGGAVALALSLFTGLRASTSVLAGLTGAATAGGLFFLPFLGLEPGLITGLLSRDLLTWPAALVGPDWAHFPLWASAVLPAFIGFVFGPSKRLGGAALGLCAGFGMGLIHASIAGTLDPWWLGDGLGRLWLGVNGLAALGAGAAVAGLIRLTQQER